MKKRLAEIKSEFDDLWKQSPLIAINEIASHRLEVMKLVREIEETKK